MHLFLIFDLCALHFLMKIGLVCPYTFSRPGGVQEHVKALYQEFKKFGQEVKIIVPRKSKTEDYGGDVILLGRSIEAGANDSIIDLSLAAKPLEIRRLLAQEQFDILHFHGLAPFLPFQILKASKATNILTWHSVLEGSKTFKYLTVLRRMVNFYLKKKFQGLILVSAICKNEIKGFLGHQTVIPNGVDLQRFSPNLESLTEFKDGSFNILFVGRIEKRKGLIYLLRAFLLLQKKHYNLRLIVVGDGDQRENCELFVAAKKVQNVIFCGAVSKEDLPRYYATADLFISPATHGESFGIVLLEAMACGTPVLGFANNGYQGVLKEKAADCLAEPRNVWELAEKMAGLLKDEKKREELREWGLKEVKKYSWPKVAEKVLDFYEEVLKKQGKDTQLLR